MTRFPFRVVADPNVLIAAAITRNPDSPVRTLVTAATQEAVLAAAEPDLQILTPREFADHIGM